MHLTIILCLYLVSLVFINPAFSNENPANGARSVQKEPAGDSNLITFQELHEAYAKQVRRLKKDFDAQIRAASTDEEKRALQTEFKRQKRQYSQKFEESVRELQQGRK